MLEIAESIIALTLGLLIGALAGLTPGIHSNLVATLTITLLPLTVFNPIVIIFFLISMTITHILVESIPTIYLGATESDSFLAVLPGHKLLLQGKALEAIESVLVGVLIGMGALILTVPFFIYVVPVVEETIKPVLPFTLIGLSTYLILREDRKIISIIIFLLAGILGYVSLNLPLKEPLLPLLSGLFGLSSLTASIAHKSKIPKQERVVEKILTLKQKIKISLKTLIIGPICSLLPAIGGGYAALISSELGKTNEKEFLATIGAMSILTTGASFFIVLSIDKARTGTAAALQSLSLPLSASIIITIIVATVISSFLAIRLTRKLSRIAGDYLPKINYKLTSMVVALLIVGLTLIISGALGLLVLITGTALGIFSSESGTKKTNLMGCLIIPTIMYYLI